jgi:hypothetical protein
MTDGKQYKNIELSFQAKQPYTTWALRVKHRAGDITSRVITSRLEEQGWAQDPWGTPPDHEGNVETVLTKEGSDLFGGWTEKEQESFVSEAARTLKELGFDEVPMIRLQLQDLI